RIAAPAVDEPRSEDDLCVRRAEKRRHEFRILVWAELEVGVLNDDEVAGRVREACSDGGAFAAIDRLTDDARGTGGADRLQRFPRVVRRSVVDDDDLLPQSVHVNVVDRSDDSGNGT